MPTKQELSLGERELALIRKKIAEESPTTPELLGYLDDRISKYGADRGQDRLNYRKGYEKIIKYELDMLSRGYSEHLCKKQRDKSLDALGKEYEAYLAGRKRLDYGV